MKKIITKNILFVLSGAFFELKDIIKKRMNKQKVGFGADIISEEDDYKSDILRNSRTEDLVKFGYESEFAGRLPVIAVFNDLDVEGLYKILKNPNSTVIRGKKLDFKAYDIDLEFKDEALKLMAEMAYKEKTGARGLVSVCEKILIKFEKKLPSTHINKLVVTRDLIKNPDKILKSLLVRSSMKRFQAEFLTDLGIVLEFDEKAVEEISNIADKENTDFNSVCKKLFKDYGYGLTLLEKKSFKVTQEVVKKPDIFLNTLIKKTYKSQSEGKNNLLKE